MVHSQNKKILFISGTRAEFGKMKALIAKIRDSQEFTYRIFVTGMHMLARYGSTYLEFERTGFSNVYFYINQDGAVNSQMDLALASTIQGLGLYIREFPADLIVVHGDRIEALAGAIVGALNNILVAHIEGGELSGTIDELLRHSITKLSHIHLVYNEQALKRLVQMGERKESIHIIGSPGVDIMLSDELPPLSEVRERYDIHFERYGIFAYHPVTTELDSLQAQIREVITALKVSGLNFVAIYPNNDNGRDIISEEIALLESHPNFRILPSMRFEHYLTLLKRADVLIGNSSSGIHEAPVYGIPTINIGRRQMNRTSHQSVVNVPETTDAILAALRNLAPRSTGTYLYGNGNSAEKFMSLLRSDQIWNTPKQKQFLDI